MNITPDTVKVIQADRDAAADAVLSYRGHKNHDWQGRIRRGEADDGELVQAFARHRLSATEGMRHLLREARWYVNDSFEAHGHSDGRDLLNRIDAALHEGAGE